MKINNMDIAALILFMIFSIQLNAQQLVYKPINPSFALGDSFNASWLLAHAQAQNDINDPNAKTTFQRDILEEFSTSLNRSILSQLSKKILNDTFGEGMMNEGVYEFDNFNVEISSVSEGLSVRIIDVSNGNQTEIIIPYF